MGHRSDTALVMLVLTAVGCVLAAPVAGRMGAPALAELLMWTSAGCGVSAFVVATVATVRAARREITTGPTEPREGGR
jgi:hypothetical protein